jgi:hypothetical protein
MALRSSKVAAAAICMLAGNCPLTHEVPGRAMDTNWVNAEVLQALCKSRLYAINISTDYQKSRAPIPPCERHCIGIRHNDRHRNRLVSETLNRQHPPKLLRKRRSRKLVKYQLRHHRNLPLNWGQINIVLTLKREAKLKDSPNTRTRS